MNDPRNIGIGPGGRAFMGALLRLGDALEAFPSCDSGRLPEGEDAERSGVAECEASQSGGRDSERIAQPSPPSPPSPSEAP